MSNHVIRRIKEIVINLSGLNIEPDDIDDDEKLFGADGALDSLKTLQLISGIEEEFGFRFTDEELNIELFESITTLANTIKAKLEVQR